MRADTDTDSVYEDDLNQTQFPLQGDAVRERAGGRRARDEPSLDLLHRSILPGGWMTEVKLRRGFRLKSYY
jgi:hypothetical protein